ncbi:ABC transporter permease [Streptomyces sp. MUM 203J]|uniref:FtsX-like permease family protein n=1 Tax=Streptomyces sp. MUM 203J TaxID=2791990 RepID=UPI001F041978|nr:FtsX-like permease family protein [Streptomyces sp. MUM 203J]MCH0539003.1 ABC transporter permease [Streptomyces sp. MUM 203J]
MLGFLVRRAWARRTLVAAVLFTITLTGCVLTTLAAYGNAVADAGLRRVLAERETARTLLEVEASVRARPDDRDRLDTRVHAAAEAAFDGLPVRVESAVRSGSYQLPPATGPQGDGPGRDGDAPLTLLAAMDPARVTFGAGERPGPARDGAPVPVAVPEAAAQARGLEPGDRMTLTDRRDGKRLEVRVTGLYRPADRDDPYWRLDPLRGLGVRTLDLTTYGPLLTDPSAFTGGGVAPDTRSWQARADFTEVTADRADRLRDTVSQAVTGLTEAPEGGLRATSELPALLAETERALVVSRSAVLVGAAQLALLAGCAIVLVSGALHEPRAPENALLRARGGTGRRLAALAAAEALLLALPTAAVAALTAGPLTRMLAEYGPRTVAGIRPPGPADARTWAVAASVALACAAVLIAPALRRRDSYVRERAARIRRPALGAALRAGGDAGLLAVAVAAYQQLARYAEEGGPADAGGLFGADPVLVLAPALCLLAGAVPAVRLLPLAVRATRWTAARSRGLVTAVAHWQLARRPGRAAGPMLLGVLAVASAVLATGQGAGWDRSQQDRADHTAGADLRVTGSYTPAFGRGGVHDGLPGVAAATPVVREPLLLPGSARGTLLAMDSRQAAGILRLRPDLADEPAARLYAPLRGGEHAEPGIVLPDGTRQLRLTVRLRNEGADPRAAADGADGAGRPAVGDGSDRAAGRTEDAATMRAVLQDRYGVPYTFDLGRAPVDGARHELVADLAAAAGGGAPAGPLRLIRVAADYELPLPARWRLTVSGLRAVTSGGTGPVDVPAASRWEARAEVDDPDFRTAAKRGFVEPGTDAPAVGRDGAVFDVRFRSGGQPRRADSFPSQAPYHARLTLLPAAEPGEAGRAPLAAVATDAFLEAQGTAVGETTTVEVSGVRLDARVTAAARTLPTISSAAAEPGEEPGGALLVDLAALEEALLARSVPGVQPAEWWLAAEPGRDGQIAETLRARPDGTAVLVRDELARDLASDPLGAAPRSVLAAVALAAAVLALAGCAVVTVGALRERADDIAVLRALGTPRSRIAASVAVEQGFLAAAAVGLGAVMGLVLTRLIVPLTVVTAQGARPEPEAAVVLPGWLAPCLLAVVVTVPVLVSAAAATRGGSPAAALRRMED